MPQERTSRMRQHNTTQSLSFSAPSLLRNEFTELECYLTKEYEDLKSLWLDFNEQHAKAKSEEEVLIQMLKEIKGTTIKESQNSRLDDHTDSLMRVYLLSLRKLQRLDEEDYDISQDEEMTDINSTEKESEESLPTHESDNDHEINDEIEDDEWNEDKTRLALKDMLDMMRDQNS